LPYSHSSRSIFFAPVTSNPVEAILPNCFTGSCSQSSLLLTSQVRPSELNSSFIFSIECIYFPLIWRREGGCRIGGNQWITRYQFIIDAKLQNLQLTTPVLAAEKRLIDQTICRKTG